MRGEASRIADRVSRDSLAPKLRDSGEDAWRIGNELFTITNVLDHNIQLERALTDPSRPVEDKVAVVKTLIGDDAHPLTMEIMSDLVARRWSRVSDIANAAEDFGVDGMMYYADHTNATLQVSIELAQLHSALLNLPVVRSKLYDATVPRRSPYQAAVQPDRQCRLQCGDQASGRACDLQSAQSPLSADHSVADQQVLPSYGRIDGHRHHATPLSKEQVKKLVAIYSAKTGHPVHINSVVDPTVLGWYAHPGGRRGHRQHGGRTAATSSAHGEGDRLTARHTVNKPETRLD